MRCERKPDSKSRCKADAVAFVMGQNLCARHDTYADQPDSACTHSLAPSGRCALCGARTEEVR